MLGPVVGAADAERTVEDRSLSDRLTDAAGLGPVSRSRARSRDLGASERGRSRMGLGRAKLSSGLSWRLTSVWAKGGL